MHFTIYLHTYLHLWHIVEISDVIQLTEGHDVVVLEVDFSVETFDKYIEIIEAPVFNYYFLSRLGLKWTVELKAEDLTSNSQDKPVSLNLRSFTWLSMFLPWNVNPGGNTGTLELQQDIFLGFRISK